MAVRQGGLKQAAEERLIRQVGIPIDVCCPKPALEEGSGAASLGVDRLSIRAAHPGQERRHPAIVRGSNEKVEMARHQAVGGQCDRVLSSLAKQEPDEAAMVLRPEEDRLVGGTAVENVIVLPGMEDDSVVWAWLPLSPSCGSL